ncbi:NAD(P)H-binding protein [Aquimarina intermedia]|uniref:Putative NAD(P)-binding protein n=1 Tax=Aquimarina intermedia TaxID=350814 RepID=A0A5S5CFB0_9FLAO|nr:NAD(P)H-binding protein [Aquimarina intermedia]TYP76986.1 putative NAD(P)-binding protein [Aquimarina intermedia]
MSKIAIVLGATGLTGHALLQQLLEDSDYDKVKLFSRSSSNTDHPKVEEYLIDLFKLDNYADAFTGDVVFCCIGTTKSKTPNKNLYKKIDYGIPLAAAKLCVQNKISSFMVVSALGANPKSKIFYNRIKGEMQGALLKLAIDKTYVLQPSLIDTKREERRIGEYLFIQFMRIINPLLAGNLKKYRSIKPETIAKAMRWLDKNDYDKEIIESDTLQDIALKM